MKQKRVENFILQADTFNTLIKTGQLALQNSELISQLMKVLRLQKGDKVSFMRLEVMRPKRIHSCLCEINELHKKSATFTVLETKMVPQLAKRSINLLYAMPNKPAKLELVLQKGTEIGFDRLTIFTGEFSQSKHKINDERLQKIAIEAAEQSENFYIPEITHEASLQEALERRSSQYLAAMERSTENESLLETQLHDDVTIIVGPEGGFSDAEKQLIQKLNIQSVTLGDSILRNETAAILGLGLLSLRS